MNAFLTGSHVYGEPRPDSDVDLVIRCDEDTWRTLAALADNPQVETMATDQKGGYMLKPSDLHGEGLEFGAIEEGAQREGLGNGVVGAISKSLRFGRLNLIVCVEDRRFAAFRLGTIVLEDRSARADVSREQAVELLTSLRELK
jgi:hypothetical protein